MSGDLILGTLLVVTLVNIARCLSTLRALIYMMREANPLLYQQVDGGFFNAQKGLTKQVRLYQYLKNREYVHHHDDVFTAKCDKVRSLFMLSIGLFAVTVFLAFGV